MNHDKEEKGIVAGQRLGTSTSGGGPSAGLKLETFVMDVECVTLRYVLVLFYVMLKPIRQCAFDVYSFIKSLN